MREENRSEIIHDALNLLDDEMIEEVDRLRGSTAEKEKASRTKGIRPWRKWAALASSICILIVVSRVWNASIGKGAFQQGSGNTTMENAQENENDAKVIIPTMKVNLEKEDGVASDMLALFIYQGRCYVQTCDYMTKDVVGDYVCTSTGLIDEWTTKDGCYVELAGSIEEKFYEIKGIDPKFMLCAVYENGVVETFIHNNGITLDKGSELLVDRLGLDENYRQISYLTSKEWENQYKTKLEPTDVPEVQREVFNQFIESFKKGDFVYAKSLGINRDVVYGSDAMYHLYITTEEGVPLHFLLLGDGYVSFYGLNQVCVQVDEEVYNEIIDILKEK